ncbi:MAG: tRNA (guanine-N(1)-)-methyltransferase [Firmicutes bacterium]|nr:tRNA (guanine-N(1)-)-methyltransferase [candidate division NPL-UPA2 bacterium]MBT9155751.1 tRNA (guanine-N(1)-)-methyltransferase [candidate division NPL-UPA2 bacterium]
MRVDVLTLFPEMFAGVTNSSILRRAREQKLLEVCLTDIRDFALDKHRVVDDYPFGGGAGMVMKPEPVVAAVESVVERAKADGCGETRVILMSPQGTVLTQARAAALSGMQHLVLICGHYEGIDHRVMQLVVHEEISVGDYVLTGGELPAMIVIDCVARLLPGVLGCPESASEESFASEPVLEYPHYTRPREFRGVTVPEVLLSGNHREIGRWRRGHSLRRTLEKRPELLQRELNRYDRECLALAKGDSPHLYSLRKEGF